MYSLGNYNKANTHITTTQVKELNIIPTWEAHYMFLSSHNSSFSSKDNTSPDFDDHFLALFFHHICVGTCVLYFGLFYLMPGFFPSTLCLCNTSRFLVLSVVCLHWYVFHCMHSSQCFCLFYYRWTFFFLAMNSRSPGVHVQPCLAGIYLGLEPQGYRVSICSSLVDMSICLSEWLYQFLSFQKGVGIPVGPSSCLYLVMVLFLILTILMAI